MNALDFIYPEYEVVRDAAKCVSCRVCERECANGATVFDAKSGLLLTDDSKCVNCQRCVAMCPVRAIKVIKSGNGFRANGNWSRSTICEVYRQASTGGVLLSSMGNPHKYPVYWDRILINASQVTNPPIDPLREPMETRVFLGGRGSGVERDKNGRLKCSLPPHLDLSMPMLFSAMSYGSISYNAHEALAGAAEELGTFYNTGEGGLHENFYRYGKNTIVQVASGRLGVHGEYLNAGAAIEIKMGQGAKPGIGGHLPGSKMAGDIARTRMVPEGSSAISPAPHHDIYSIEDLRQLVYSLKEATGYKKPVIIKIAAVHNIAAIASDIARTGADIIAINGFRGGIHMKEYGGQTPVMIVGGSAGSFLGEYQAGGMIIVLGLDRLDGLPPVHNFCAAGMYGGRIFLRTEKLPERLPHGVSAEWAGDEDMRDLGRQTADFCRCFSLAFDEVMNGRFAVLKPAGNNPYEKLYVNN